MLYRVMLAGTVAPGADIDDVRARFMRATGQQEVVATRLLSGSPNVIKRGISQTEAERIVGVLRAIGAVASVESEPPIFTIDEPSEIFAKSTFNTPTPPNAALEAGQPSVGPALRSERAEDTGAPSAPPPNAVPAYIAERGGRQLVEVAGRLDIETMYRAIVGPKNADIYVPFFLARDAGGSFFSWHWPGFFVQFAWSLYRKCWAFAFAGLLATVLLALLCAGIVGVMLGIAGAAEETIGLIGNLMGWVGAALVATTVKGFYHRKARSLIAATTTIADANRRIATLTQRGGTSAAWVWLFLLIPLIGIVAAIALPAYQDYVVRAKVNDVLIAVAPLKAEVAEMYLSKGVLEEPSYDAVLSGHSGKYIDDIGMTERGVLVITFAIEPLRSTRVAFVPGKQGSDIVWTCKNIDAPPKYLPASCRD